MECSVRLLGRFEVTVDGRAVPVDGWRSRRAADLVKLLALAPDRTLHRERVMAALWPELGTEAAAANLRKAVHYARRAMGADAAIESAAGALTLCGGRAEVDTARFEAAAEAALNTGRHAGLVVEACASAAALYAGDLLPGDPYEPWLEEPRRRLRERYVAVLRGAGQWERLLAVDPTDELAHRELMRSHLSAGRRRDAIRQFERLRDALREHIGVAPDRETIALYEEVLAAEGVPPEPGQRAAVLIATGLVHLHRKQFAEAERQAREARELAVAAGLAHELGDASTLLALVSSYTGRWHEEFRAEFIASLSGREEFTVAMYDAHLCFAEYHHLGGPTPRAYAEELLALADAAGSRPGRGIAQLMLGEAHLMAGRNDEALDWLGQAMRTNHAARATSGWCISIERLAQAEVARQRHGEAGALLARARPAAETSPLRSHLLVRLLGVSVQAATSAQAARTAVVRAEQALTHATKVCEPCSMGFHTHAALGCAGAGDLLRARRHLADAERISALWPSGPWTAAVWEVRAGLRRAEGQPGQAAALLAEAADAYAKAGWTADAARCR
jgi:DNA-binding SARP family transcriptional activator